jgi:hypothetical protein
MIRLVTRWTWRLAKSIPLLALLTQVNSVAQSPTQKPEAGPSSKFDAPVELQPIERFNGRTTLRSPRAAKQAQNVQVTLRNWIIPNRQRVERLAESGFLVVQVRSGEDLTTVINGERRQRKVEEFFTVPAGTTLSVETGNDSAILQILSIGPAKTASAPK